MPWPCGRPVCCIGTALEKEVERELAFVEAAGPAAGCCC